MHVFEFILAIVVITTLGDMISKYLKSKKTAPKLAEEEAKKEARIQALEDRVQILERIVTDQKQTLKDKIDAL